MFRSTYLSKITFGFLMVFLLSCGSDDPEPDNIDDEVTDECVSADKISEFMFEGKRYQIIQERKIWRDAAACAVELGGFLAEINSEEEQNAIFSALNSTSIEVDDTRSNDGGGADN